MLKVNGKAYDWGDVDLKIPGLNIQVKEISYDDELEMEEVYALKAKKQLSFRVFGWKLSCSLFAARSNQWHFMVDGCNGFIMLDKNDSPKVALHIENEMRWAKKHQKLHPDKPLPHITPYVFRHTCCTNMNFILLGIAEFMLAGILAAGTFALALGSKDTEEFVDKTISNRYEKHVNSIYRTDGMQETA